MLRIALALGILCACGRGPAVDAAGGDELALAPELEALFAAAERDPAALVALVEAASAQIARLDPGTAHLLADWLEPYSARLFFGPERLPHMERVGLQLYRVRAGDLPAKIARQHRFDHPLFARWNPGYDPRRIRVGQELKLLDLSSASLQLMVDRERHRLAAWRVAPDGAALLVAYVPVGLGAAETPTPAGTTKVVQRVRDPQWTHPRTGVVYAPDDPGNLLGGYWMRLDPEGIGQEGIGFHGYTGDDPASWLGKNRSDGCVRLVQDDMDRIFHLAVEGTPVRLGP